jgi:DNA replication protein
VTLQNPQYDEIMRNYNRRQLNHKNNLDEHITIAYKKIPRLEEIDQEIASLSIQKARYLLGENVSDLNLNDIIESLSEERIALLSMHGFAKDYLQIHYDCPQCKDTGYIDGDKCSCFKRAAIELLYDQSNIKDILKQTDFASFSLDYYASEPKDLSSRDLATVAFNSAKAFVDDFRTSFDNLFLYGDTGVGKTFLSHCIARQLLDRGLCVIYFSAFDLFKRLAKGTFSHNIEDAKQNEPIFDCDLLIIDDLGTELTNSFVTSSLFLCINERLMRRKPTIISTNLALEDFSEIYSERIFSRISSNYTMLKMIGDDIRIQQKLSGGNQ